nr:MAG TPA: holin [Bacteriophage sp.]DAR83230.1 MAG TPA: holin [Caudoviricetes sp.]
MYNSKSFWSGLLERSISTFAQSLLGALVVGSSVVDIDWNTALGIAGTATLAAVLKAFAAPAETDRAIPTDTPSTPGYTPRHAG